MHPVRSPGPSEARCRAASRQSRWRCRCARRSTSCRWPSRHPPISLCVRAPPPAQSLCVRAPPQHALPSCPPLLAAHSLAVADAVVPSCVVQDTDAHAHANTACAIGQGCGLGDSIQLGSPPLESALVCRFAEPPRVVKKPPSRP
eukprot:4182297-Prymnesium_polylepis.1